MNAGLSHNKCLIGRSCYYPHHFYYYEGTDLRDDGGGQKGPGADWMGEGSFLVRPGEMQGLVRGEMVRPVLVTPSSAEGLELGRGYVGAGKGTLGSRAPDSNTSFAFPSCETTNHSTSLQACFLAWKTGGPPLSLLGNTEKIGINTDITYQRNVGQRRSTVIAV